MKTTELEKSKVHLTEEIIKYVSHSVVIKSILKKITGNISIVSADSGEGLAEKTSPYDTFIQIIDGKAEIVISGEAYFLETGCSIVIPANSTYFISPADRFKMILTLIKSDFD